MSWWAIELITNVILVAVVVVLGPLIKRFGRAYAGDIFRGNPRTGKSYLVLMDVAYYLIFTAYVLFTVTLSQPPEWRPNARDALGDQLQHEVSRIGGMLLLMGVAESNLYARTAFRLDTEPLGALLAEASDRALDVMVQALDRGL